MRAKEPLPESVQSSTAMWLFRSTVRKSALLQAQTILTQASLVSVLVLVAYLDLEIMLTSVPEEDAQARTKP